MRKKLEQRLEDLRQEMTKGRRLLQDLQKQERDLQEQILRIGGAIQVIEELLVEDEPDALSNTNDVEVTGE